MPDDTKTPPNELPPSDQPWGKNELSDGDIATIQEFLSNSARIVFDYYNSLCELGLNRTEAFALAQLFQTQYWAVVLNTIYRGKSKTSD